METWKTLLDFVYIKWNYQEALMRILDQKIEKDY